MLAVAAEPNADATVWTLTLRDGVTWHDGKPLTADDVVYTIKNWVNPQNYYSYTLSAIMDGKGVRKRDARTVEVSLLKAVADFPSLACVLQRGRDSSGYNECRLQQEPDRDGRVQVPVIHPRHPERVPGQPRLLADGPTVRRRAGDRLRRSPMIVPGLPRLKAGSVDTAPQDAVSRSPV